MHLDDYFHSGIAMSGAVRETVLHKLGPAPLDKLRSDIRMTRRTLLAAVSILAILAPVVHAGCKSDCADEYRAAKDDCLALHDDPDEADELRLCLDNAYSDYEDCMNQCDS